jgi:hypothetical protein
MSYIGTPEYLLYNANELKSQKTIISYSKFVRVRLRLPKKVVTKKSDWGD